MKMDEFYEKPSEQPKIINHNVDKCVICGKIIPEGSQVCTECHNEWR